VTSADEIVAQGDVHQQIGLLRHADVADFEIGAAVALTREHPLVSGGETSVVTNALQRPQDILYMSLIELYMCLGFTPGPSVLHRVLRFYTGVPI
jgi:hypothetical protein